ncbi:MAG: exonuclease subunit SbcD [Candidatus Babeliales bacterium]
MVRFIHTADIHFGVENYGRIDAATGIHSRLLDFDKALSQCIDYALQEEVDFFLFAGDAYKTATPSPTQQRLFVRSFLRLYKAGIPVVIVVGNHDHPLSYGKAHSLALFGDLPVDGFYLIDKPSLIQLTTKRGKVQIVGIPWPTRNTLALSHKQHGDKAAEHITQYISRAVGAIIADYAGKLDSTVPAVLTGHLTVSNGIFSGSEKRAIYGTDPVILPSQLALAPFDYVALGHLHRYQDLNKGRSPAIVYSGSLERIDFGERKEEKGFCDVTIHSKQKTTHAFVKVATRPFVQIDVHCIKGEDQTQQIVDRVKTYDLAGAIVKIVYHLPEGVRDVVDLYEVQRACEKVWYLVGIIPIQKHAVRVQRISGAVTMDFSALMTAFLEQKPEYKEEKVRLIQKACELYREAQGDGDAL